MFGIPLDLSSLNSKQAIIVAFTTLLTVADSCRRILLEWSTQPLSTSTWQADVMIFLKLEKVKNSLRGTNNTFINGNLLYYSPMPYRGFHRMTGCNLVCSLSLIILSICGPDILHSVNFIVFNLIYLPIY